MSKLRVIELERQLNRRDARINELEKHACDVKAELLYLISVEVGSYHGSRKNVLPYWPIYEFAKGIKSQ